MIDGDTFEAKLRLWFGLEKTVLVRVRGIDAPELHARCAIEAERAQAARLALRDYLTGTIITLRNLSVDKYGGRVVANVLLPDPDNLNAPLEDIDDLMLAGHLARAYNGGRRGSWCAASAAADKEG
ncbi:MAG: thermonuclease family protein [Hyphomicrobiales bacterium]|nr:thermonuclease family protein [Hyphomicrobiales bacterium]MDE2116114.1 thermonuclease family protein [Hyphomicrobiales bacterium]